MTHVDPVRPWVGDRTADFVGTKIRFLQHGALHNRADAVAALARLRRAAGKEPGSIPEIFSYTLGEELVDRYATDAVTTGERAAHISLTFYAMHQQAQSKGMHRAGREHSLGRALRRLVDSPGDIGDSPITRRFQAFGTSASLDELVHHLRGLVQLLRVKGIPQDYQQLATQLVRWQMPGGPDRVRMAWGRDFYVLPRAENTPFAEPNAPAAPAKPEQN
ncbi:type I-E CRISPR-associated protein Cse2/CasB [Amycolatopsis antarctica]|uniref:Type I-E CRISPR-associated protein Cse2/CasB n=1 Tax=Amycolatopsis antarctica TaxID=1854586 RepID=A0A263CYS4_9PSEU|nr:type I-E CRISPR-associated protein Cse2/CasB [Amycolatopsis antarctica]OZM71261.1 type I-E CRISPR-associated protein Cse2/CasB [Amycolatopsis antarctica]